MVLDRLGSQASLVLVERPDALMFLDLSVILVYRDWMEDKVSEDLQDLQAPQVQALPRETEAILDYRASPAPLGQKEPLEVPGDLGRMAGQGSKEREATTGTQVGRAPLGSVEIQATSGAKGPRV